MPKTIILAIATLLLAVAALVTDLVSPYAGGIDSAASPAQVDARCPATRRYRVPVRGRGRGRWPPTRPFSTPTFRHALTPGLSPEATFT